MTRHQWEEITTETHEPFHRPADATQLRFSHALPVDLAGLTQNERRDAVVAYANAMTYLNSNDYPVEIYHKVCEAWFLVLWAETDDWEADVPIINRTGTKHDRPWREPVEESRMKENMKRWFIEPQEGDREEFTPDWEYLETMHVVKWRNPFKSPYSDEELSKMFEKEQATWQKAWNDTNTTEGELKTRLTAALKKAPTIKKVVCFGLGHPAIADKGCAKMRQHCFALSLRDLLDSLLESPHQGVVELCVQDPAYLEQEKRLLKAQGIQVLDGALGKQEGFAAVDEETFVLSIGTTVPVQPIVCDSTSPAAMLWNTFPEPQKDYHFPPIPKLVGFRHPGSGEDGQKIKDFRGVDPLWFAWRELWPQRTQDKLQQEYNKMEPLPEAHGVIRETLALYIRKSGAEQT